MKNKLETIIGLEIHLEVKTKSKFFCSCLNKESAIPNKNICPICLGHPGTLPVINKEVLIKALKLGVAVKGKINDFCNFDRKNYFYPDLPKGYQISQYQLPLIKGGEIKTEKGVVNLERIHLEEDTAKIFHKENYSLLDFNRAGVPLLEIVTLPELKSPEQAKFFLEELQRIARYLEISSANMEKGQMRCDANISLRPEGDQKYYPKTEIKNLNSFKAVEKALSYEEKKQKELWFNNKSPKHQTTKGWNEKKGVTVVQREKQEEKDYRYFPEPDLPPLKVKDFKKQGIILEEIKRNIIELPFEKKQRFINEYSFDEEQARLLTAEKELSYYVEKVISELKAWLLSLETVEGSEEEIWQKNKNKLTNLVSKWLINYLLPLQKKDPKKDFQISAENFAEFIILIYQKKIISNIGQKILTEMFFSKKDVDRVIEEKNLELTKNTSKLNQFVKEVIKENPSVVEKYKKGKENVIKFLIGQAMKKVKGQADVKDLEKLLKDELRG